MDTTPPRPTAVVVGAGISGLTAAHVLNRTHEVVLVEARTRLGGHAHTHEIDTPAGRLGIDSGFIVHNERTIRRSCASSPTSASPPWRPR